IAGSGTISAAQTGVVEVATYHYSYGNYVVINHGKINGVTIKTLYAHMQSGLSVSVGQTVSQGQKIGVMGTTGSSTGVHLHFEVQENGAVVNPMNYINGITTGTPGATTPTTPSNGNSVVVVSGDTLWKIANANGLTVAELKKLNNLTSDAIMTGQVLILKSAGTDTPNKPSTPTVTPGTTSITVASGDTLWKIANANGLSVAELKTLNNLSSDYIYPGQSLKVTKSVTNGNNSTGVTPPTVTKPSVPTVVNKMYTVQKGDTLYKIASDNGVSVAELKAWNNLNTDIIFVNQSLKLAATTSSTQTTAPTTSAPEASGNTYTVQKGDTLYSIAKKKGVSLAALIEANDMTSNVIYVGQVITF
ncbi:MAG: LysM peptidoglycan-binding domain-containing protein, partial [Trichococcus flocculiformis]